MHYISNENFCRLLGDLKQVYRIFVPFSKNNHRFYHLYTNFIDHAAIGGVRAFEPLKSFFLRAREKVAEAFNSKALNGDNRPVCIIGPKACDLKGFRIQDHVFKDHEYVDPYYVSACESNLIISADCTFAIPTCFCLALNVKPYPQEDFDINLSTVNGGFVVETGSEKGFAVVESHSGLFDEASKGSAIARNEVRRRVIKEVKKNIEQNHVPHQDELEGAVALNYEAAIWADEAKTCVECGACNTICPTCHCFLLYDQKDEGRMARFRVWDSCMLKDFARVAGGGNPRSHLWMRLRNRFEKKFDFFPKIAGVYACTGCGRCITACPAKIDIRRVLKRLVSDG